MEPSPRETLSRKNGTSSIGEKKNKERWKELKNMETSV